MDDFGKRVNAAVPLLQTELHRHGYATGSFITNINAGAAAGLDRGFDLVHDAIADFRQKDALRTVPLAAIDSWLSTVGERPFCCTSTRPSRIRPICRRPSMPNAL